MKTAILALALLSSLISFSARAQGTKELTSAQNYPSRPLRAVVPNVPGGGTDTISRIVAVGLSEALGKQVVVDNRAGAGGSLAGSIVVNATPDGYTVLMGTISTQSINPVLLDLPYDPVKDFAPISMMGTTPNVIVANLSFPVKSVKELVAYAKANPGKISYGSTGVGGSPHLSMELLKSMSGIDMVHVPYKGAGAMLPDLLSGQIQVANVALSGQLPHIKAGRVRALAITSAKRSPKLPNVPTVAESGIPGYEVIIWYGMFAPAAVPKAIVAKLNAKLVEVLKSPDIMERLDRRGIDAAPSTPGELAAFVKTEIAKWSKVVKLTGMKINN